MKISVDINHPANVHYFKNFIKEMEDRGHEILITASNKEISFKLLDLYGFKYHKIGSYGHSIIEKLIKIIWLDIKMFIAVRKFQPDIFLGFASVRSAHIGRLLGKKSIILTDTEHAKLGIALFESFSDFILTPNCFLGDFGKKHVRFNSLMELMYLHPKRFIPDSNTLKEIGLSESDKFVVIRFVSWEASHDIGIKNVSDKLKLKLIKMIEKYAKVIISSENKLPEELVVYQPEVSPDRIHDLLYYATLYIGEGATMASEAAVLGTHALYLNPLFAGILEEEVKYDLLFHFDKLNEGNYNEITNKTIQMLSDTQIIKKGWEKRDRLLDDKDDATDWLINYVEQFSPK